jgi:hypothetical protein
MRQWPWQFSCGRPGRRGCAPVRVTAVPVLAAGHWQHGPAGALDARAGATEAPAAHGAAAGPAATQAERRPAALTRSG